MRLIAYDLRGHGRSTVPPQADYSFARHLDDLGAVIQHFRLERPFVVGHSIGGNVAVAATGAETFAIAGAVSLDGYGPGVYDRDDRKRRQAELDLEIYASLEPDTVTPEEVPNLVQRYERMMRAIGADVELASVTTLRSLADRGDGTIERRPPMSHQQALAAGLQDFDFFQSAFASRVPVLVVKCKQTVPVARLTTANQEYIAQLDQGSRKQLERLSREGNAEVTEIDGGHMLHLQSPTEVAELVAGFIARKWDR